MRLSIKDQSLAIPVFPVYLVKPNQKMDGSNFYSIKHFYRSKEN